ncbi:MAG TPA: universal stress protein [Pyrinomonadaceae bacterium]|nr:universal stress protein [Pyrinomonadaceae bacterium]
MKILLAIDGSKSSECVVNELKNITLSKDSEIIILSTVEKMMPIVGEPFGGAVFEYEAQIEKQSLEAAKDIVKEAKEKIEKDFDCYVKTEVVIGSPKYSIVEKSKEWQTDLIIVGSHGYRLWERVLLGSVSTFVAQHAECSVLISRCPHKE